MKIIHRYNLNTIDVPEENFAIFGPAARIDWRPLNKENLLYIRDLAELDLEGDKVDVINKMLDQLQ